jgi:hypothetical protein
MVVDKFREMCIRLDRVLSKKGYKASKKKHTYKVFTSQTLEVLIYNNHTSDTIKVYYLDYATKEILKMQTHTTIFPGKIFKKIIANIVKLEKIYEY